MQNEKGIKFSKLTSKYPKRPELKSPAGKPIAIMFSVIYVMSKSNPPSCIGNRIKKGFTLIQSRKIDSNYLTASHDKYPSWKLKSSPFSQYRIPSLVTYN